MSAVAAGVRGRLSEQARQFPVGAFVATGILATALGAEPSVASGDPLSSGSALPGFEVLEAADGVEALKTIKTVAGLCVA